jgi:uncharacterized protein YgbK (DUF1537 family)
LNKGCTVIENPYPLKAARLKAILQGLPPDWPRDPLPEIQEILSRSKSTLVVLDDDPTGSQSVQNTPVLTEWSLSALQAETDRGQTGFYVLTNSRSLPPDQAEALNRIIGGNLATISRRTGRAFAVVSRGDSTLRGHFPNEVKALAEGLGVEFDAWLLIPALPDAGRITIGDIHYVVEGEKLIPVGETAYARDATFGYGSSNLREWVAEKTDGKISATEVASISIELIRTGGPVQVSRQLETLAHGRVCILNAVNRRDLEVIALGILLAEERGKRFLYRTSPSFVPVRLGVAPYPFLTKKELNLPESIGGLVIVGSHVPKTTLQIESLFEKGVVERVEIQVEELLDAEQRSAEIVRAASLAEEKIRSGRDTVIYTSRNLITGGSPAASLLIGQKVSSGLIEVLRKIKIRPRYVLAKGGITSSDVATQGLGVKRAIVMGQIIPGVSVWRLGPESRYEGLPYLVFPGNIGGPEALADVVLKLKPGQK